MSDTEDDDFTKAVVEGFGEDDKLSTEKPSETAVETPATDKTEEKPAGEEKKEDPKSTETGEGADKSKEKEAEPVAPTATAPAEAPAVEEAPKPLTEESILKIINESKAEERNSVKELDDATNTVLEKYYPNGLSNVLTDEKSGKELRSPADVVEASGGEMTTEQAAQWILNEQFKLDKQVSEIKDQARNIAETTVNFRRDAVAAVAKYEPLFKAYPHLQTKVFDQLMKQVKIDKEKDVVLSAPDVMNHYDFYLEPYQQAFEFANKQSATNPVAPAAPEPAKPGAEDRLDETGDGGQTPVNDPNDFAQQVTKELNKGI